MAFKIVEKRTKGQPLPENVMSVNKGGVLLPREFTLNRITYPFVEIYVDEENNKIGFKMSADKKKGFTLSKNENNNLRIYLSCNTITSRIPLGKYVFTREGELFVIQVSNIARK